MTTLFVDNPELIRYVRTSTRKGKALTAYVLFGVVCLACLLVNLAVYTQLSELGMHRGTMSSCFRGIFFQIVGANFLLLLLLGTHACGESINLERQTNTIEFQRLTGMDSYKLAFGKIIGCPLLYYLLAALGMPFTMICVLGGGVSMAGFVVSYVLLVASGLMFCSAGTLLSSARRKATARRTSPLALVLLLIFVGPFLLSLVFGLARGLGSLAGMSVLTCLLPYHSLVAVGSGDLGSYQVRLFGTSLNGIAMTVGLNLLLFLFFWAGTARRMGSDFQPIWSKKQLAVASAVLWALVAGILWEALPATLGTPTRTSWTSPLAPLCYATLVAHCWLLMVAVVSSPDLYPYRVGLRQRALGKAAGSALFDDRAMSVPLTPALALVYVAAVLAVVAMKWGGASGSARLDMLSLFFVPFVVSVIIYAEAAQGTKLLAPENGGKLLAGVLFGWAVLPLVAGSIAAASMPSGYAADVGAPIMAFSPLGACLGALSTSVSSVVQNEAFWGATVVFSIVALWLWSVLRRRRAVVEGRAAAVVGAEGA